jgi:hypothetical protein
MESRLEKHSDTLVKFFYNHKRSTIIVGCSAVVFAVVVGLLFYLDPPKSSKAKHN